MSDHLTTNKTQLLKNHDLREGIWLLIDRDI
jgi:hypothetical protein